MLIAEDMFARKPASSAPAARPPWEGFFLSARFRSGIGKKSQVGGRFGSARIPSGFPCTLSMLEYLWLFRAFLGNVRAYPIF